MKPIYNPFIVFSAYQSNQSLEFNKTNHMHLTRFLKQQGTTFIEVNGFYNGNKEKSILMILKDLKIPQWLLDTLKVYNQESILLVDMTRNAELLYLDGKRESLGQWRSILNVSGLKSYTEFEGKYFTCERK